MVQLRGRQVALPGPGGLQVALRPVAGEGHRKVGHLGEGDGLAALHPVAVDHEGDLAQEGSQDGAALGVQAGQSLPLGTSVGLMGNSAIARIAQETGKPNAQVILRWHIQTGKIVFPKSTNPQHLAANLDIFASSTSS